MAARDDCLRALLAAKRNRHLTALAAANFVEQIGDRVQLARTDDQIDVRCSFENDLLVLLGHAAHHADHFVRVTLFRFADLAQRAVDLFLGVLAHAAGVEQHAIGFLRRIDDGVAVTFQVSDHHFAVQHVHLAADGLDVDAFIHLCCVVRFRTIIQSSDASSATAGIASRPSWLRST